jgi:hypothetical protein
MTMIERLRGLCDEWDRDAHFMVGEFGTSPDHLVWKLDQLKECASELRAILDWAGEPDQAAIERVAAVIAEGQGCKTLCIYPAACGCRYIADNALRAAREG